MKPVFRWDAYVVVLSVAILAFVAFKIPYLDLPFYWDEAWVYAPAVKAMWANGPSLLPTAISPDLSRGHPLLFHALAAAWMTVAGTSNISAHVFALLVSVLLVIATYRLGARSGSRIAGLCGAGLLLVNEAFLAQSGLLLPEVLLALFLVLAFTEYLTWRPWPFVLMALAALLVKESAVVPLAGLVGWQILLAIGQRTALERRSHIVRFLVMCVPFIVTALFFLIQRIQLGWFLFPEHVGMLSFDPKDLKYKANLVFFTVFEDQGMVALTYAFAIAAPLFHKGLAWWRRLLIPLLFITMIKVLCGRWTLPDGPTLAVVLLCFLAVQYLYFTHQEEDDDANTVMACSIAVLGIWGFTSLNFFSERYLLPMIPFVLVGSVRILNDALNKWDRKLPTALVLLIMIFLLFSIGNSGSGRDVKLSYADAIRMNQDRITYCESHGLFQERFFGSFTTITYMTDPGAGYLSSGKTFAHVSNQLETNTLFALVDGGPEGEEALRVRAAGFELEQAFTHGNVVGGLYRRTIAH